MDITGAKKLFLVVDDGGDNFTADHFDWCEPRLIGPHGERKLTDIPWVRASAGWGKPSTKQAVSGKEMTIEGKKISYGIGTHVPSLIEFDLPAGYTRFKSFAGLDDGGTSQPTGATVHAMVFLQSPVRENRPMTVPVSLQELGFGGTVHVRDLWQKKEPRSL